MEAGQPRLSGERRLDHKEVIWTIGSLSATAALPGIRGAFTTSVDIVGSRLADAPFVPETALESLDRPYANGYARRKFLSELLCDSAVLHIGIPVAIARGPGCRCCPPPQHTEPFRVSDVDWVPSDPLANNVVDPACPSDPRTTEGSGAGACNTRNPSMAVWDAPLPAITDAIRR
ncbi:hypothetical protein DL762_006128 [Monosporascus cannonballus]|uniref:Thioester reductase (TE) domain-containing protein n=1 Tax=Monosporascus cannonballus TaxID=155416 RepID=A0ABY0H5Z7_9PEZI|nr:hypothetical protein DL762_006128 [Monosporascus cannonballus]